MRKGLIVGVFVALASAGAALAQSPTVALGSLSCLPVDGNGVVTATISPDVAGTSVRLYFRRMNVEVEDFYYTEMQPTGNGGYWGVFPQPLDRKADKKALRNAQDNPWARWWQSKEASDHRDPNGDLDKKVIDEKAPLGKLEKRAWMNQRDADSFERWLDQLQNEPAEYFVAVYNNCSSLVAKSAVAVTEVRKDCRVALSPQQTGLANNLTIGETNNWQPGEDPFHWQCDGVVTRIDSRCVRRADERCRACVVAWWGKPWVPAAATATGVAALTLISINDNPPEASPTRP